MIKTVSKEALLKSNKLTQMVDDNENLDEIKRIEPVLNKDNIELEQEETPGAENVVSDEKVPGGGEKLLAIVKDARAITISDVEDKMEVKKIPYKEKTNMVV